MAALEKLPNQREIIISQLIMIRNTNTILLKNLKSTTVPLLLRENTSLRKITIGEKNMRQIQKENIIIKILAGDHMSMLQSSLTGKKLIIILIPS